MICKKCGEKINMIIFGLPDDICWGCLQEEQKEIVILQNIKQVFSDDYNKLKNKQC
jgi:hypothetical protein